MTRQIKQYEKPSMQVFELKKRPQLLDGSPGDGGTNPYTPDNNDYNW